MEKILKRSPYGMKLPEHNRARKVSPYFRSTFATDVRNQRLPKLDSDKFTKILAANFPSNVREKNNQTLKMEQMRLESV